VTDEFAFVPDLAIWKRLLVADPVPPVDVLERFTSPFVVPFPVQVFPLVASFRSSPVVTLFELASMAFPVVRELAARYKPAVVPVPVETLGVRLTKSVDVEGERVVPDLDQYPIVPEVGAVDVKFLLPSV